MRTVLMDSVVPVLSLALYFARVIGDGGARTSTTFRNPGARKPFISFNSEGGEIDISWDISVPFFRIPLNHVKENGEVAPLLNVNPKGLSIAGILTAILTIAVPLFSKPGPGMHYRSESPWSRMGDTINELMPGDSYITPCIQRILCTVVSEAIRSNSPTSTDKIIDGLSSHKWIKEYTNGTIVQEAIKVGREGSHDCGYAYKRCFVSTRILKNMMAQLGVI